MQRSPLAALLVALTTGISHAPIAHAQLDHASDAASPASCRQLMPLKRSRFSTWSRFHAPIDSTYASAVQQAIFDQWTPPRWKTERTDLTVLITRQAGIAALGIRHPSTSPQFDTAALRAVVAAAKAGKLPAMPTDYPQDSALLDLSLGDVDALLDSTELRTGEVQPPEPKLGNAPVTSPPGLRLSGPAQLVLEFEIDTLGTVDMSTVKVIVTPDEAYTSYALDVIRHWRYTPAVRDCRKVRATYRVRIDY